PLLPRYPTVGAASALPVVVPVASFVRAPLPMYRIPASPLDGRYQARTRARYPRGVHCNVVCSLPRSPLLPVVRTSTPLARRIRLVVEGSYRRESSPSGVVRHHRYAVVVCC